MKKEYGRSMIEMLGVLAIIGVLSIGGLAGYTMAMNRHKANEILDYATKCGVIAQTNMTTGAIDSSCSVATYMGADTLPNGATSIVVARAAQANDDPNPDTTVTITPNTEAIKGAIAGRVGVGSEASASFTLNVDTNTWTAQ